MKLFIIIFVNNISKIASSCVSTCLRIEDKVDYLIKKEGSELNKIDKELNLIFNKINNFQLNGFIKSPPPSNPPFPIAPPFPPYSPLSPSNPPFPLYPPFPTPPSPTNNKNLLHNSLILMLVIFLVTFIYLVLLRIIRLIIDTCPTKKYKSNIINLI